MMSERMASAMMWVRDLIQLHDSKEKAEEFLALLKAGDRDKIADFFDAEYPLDTPGGWGVYTPMKTPERLRDWFSGFRPEGTRFGRN